jgi:4-amino-4-deoxychorismate lyase
MSLLIESIKVLDGKFYNLFYHEQRMVQSLEKLCGIEEEINLERLLNELEVPQSGLFKCRIEYDESSKAVEFFPYVPKPIRSLRIVEHNRIDYSFKYKNRSAIDKLFAQRKDCDDILIIKRGYVTDSSFSNIVFRKGKSWFTPWSPLLKGTMRQSLIDSNKIQAEEILSADIRSFDTFRLINAMLEFDGPEIDVSNIVF